MNKVILIGRLTRDPEVRYSREDNSIVAARYTLAVDRRFKKDGEQSADFITCTAFGKSAEFTQKYLRKGTKMAVVGRIQTGSYTNNEGQKVFTTEVVIEEQEFAESKSTGSAGIDPGKYGGGVMGPGGIDVRKSTRIPENGYGSYAPDDDELPFV